MRILLSQFYYVVGKNSFNQFVKLLFCILHFCILEQTEKMATRFSCCGNKEKECVRKIINDAAAEASTRKPQAFQIILLMLGKTLHETK